MQINPDWPEAYRTALFDITATSNAENVDKLLTEIELTRDVHRGVAQVAWATAHMPSSTHVALPRKKKKIATRNIS